MKLKLTLRKSRILFGKSTLFTLFTALLVQSTLCCLPLITLRSLLQLFSTSSLFNNEVRAITGFYYTESE